MIPPRWKKVLADLFSHKIRSLLVIASIAVGLFAVGMTTTTYAILAADIRAGYLAVHAANIQIISSLFDDDFVERIRRMPGVAKAAGAYNMSLRVQVADGRWKPIHLRALTLGDMKEQSINKVELLQGIWPPEDRQVVIDINKLAETGASLGDELEIKLPSGTVRRLQVVGIVRDQTIGSASGEGGFFLSPIQGYVTSGTLPWLEQPEGFNTLYATVSQDPEDRIAIGLVADAILEEFERGGHTTASSVVRRSTDHPNLPYVDAMVAVVYSLGLLVVFLSGFLITNTLSALLNQQIEQIGVMKTIGASRWQIASMYMLLILVFSLLALAVAIPTSKQAALILLEYLAVKINFTLGGLRPVPVSSLVMMLIALLVPQAAGLYPILQGTRVSVREALSGMADLKKEGDSPVFRLFARVRGFSRPLLISLRNTFRQRLRLALTLLTLSLGGAIFIASFNVRFSLENYIDRLGRYFVADVNLTFAQPYRIERVTHDLQQVPGIGRVEGWGGARAQIVRSDGSPGESIQVLAPPAASTLIEPILLDGRWIQPGDENAVVLSELFRIELPDLRVGDSLRLKIGTKESDWIVVGFFQFAGRSAGLFAYTNYDYLSKQTGLPSRSAIYRAVAAYENLSQQEREWLGRQIEAHMTRRGYQINEVTAGSAVKEDTSRGLNILTTFLMVMSLLMALVGSIGLTGTMSLNVMERTREIGVMRAIGGSDRAIMKIVLVEGSLIGLISWILASMAALPISKMLADLIFHILFDNDAMLAFDFRGNLVWLGIVLLLSALASFLPAYNASKLTIREVLAYE